MSLQPHQQRVVEERRELDEKIAKLNTFLTSIASAQVSLAELSRLQLQLEFMDGYSAALGERIAAFEEA